MKTTIKKSIVTGIFFIVLLLGFKSTASAQVTGLYYWDDSDSIGHACYNTPINANIYWSGGAGYTTGDNLSVDINWGDGNTNNFPTNTITAGGFFASIANFTTQHTYTTPGMYYISISAIDNYLNTFSYNDSILVTSNCGAVYGTILLDNGDNIFSWGTDVSATGVPVILTTNLGSYGANTDIYGNYQITNIDHTATSYHAEIDPAWLSANGFTVIDPVAGDYNFTSSPVPAQYLQFLLDCGSSYADESVSGYGWGFLAGQSTGYIDLWFHNFTCDGTPANIDLSVNFDPMLTVFSSTIGTYNVAGNTFTSTLTGVSSYQWERIYFTVPAGVLPNTPLVFNINTNVTNYTDGYLPNNQYTINSEVRNSWDPNDKSTNVANAIDANVDEEIFYTIRFQNMGNADAYNITIKDTIDTQFDLSSFRVETQSHAGSYSVDVATRIITFTFPNIMLPPQSTDDLGSQGFIRYRITENTGLPIGSVLNNTAYIYFDGNSAIITNTTANVNTSLGIGDENDQPTLVVYPQPASEVFYIGGVNTSDVNSITILDANGKAVLKTTEAKIQEGIYIGNLATGMYFVSIETNEYTVTEKLCIQR